MANCKEDQNSAPMNRRQLSRLALAVAAGMGLVACGGGGGGSDTISLREAYDKMLKGMTKKQVREVVGRTPNSEAGEMLDYDDGAENLHIIFYTDSDKASEDYLATGVYWKNYGSPSQRLHKIF